MSNFGFLRFVISLFYAIPLVAWIVAFVTGSGIMFVCALALTFSASVLLPKARRDWNLK